MKKLFRYIFTLSAAAFLCTACSEDESINTPAEEPIPEGCGKFAINVTAPEAVTTRATTGNWLNGTEEERAIKSYHILVCQGTTIIDDIAGGELALTNADANNEDDQNNVNNYWISEFTARSKALAAGTYNFTFYALVNFTNDMIGQAGLTLTEGKVSDATLPADFETKAIRTASAAEVPDTGIPMTGKLAVNNVKIEIGKVTDIADPLIVWRMIAKLEFTFANQTSVPVRILGIEVDPINQASAGKGVYLLSTDDLNSTDNDTTNNTRVPYKTDVGPYEYTPNPYLLLAGKPAEGDAPTDTISFYVNETDATYTITPNEYSVRIKTQRAKDATATDWFEQEIRYGFTQSFNTGAAALNPNDNGFSVIRRNDWIKIPINITDWRLRIEVLAFVPIGGYPAATLDYLDELNAVFKTGGWIVIKPLVEKYEENVAVPYSLISDKVTTTDDNKKVTETTLANWLKIDAGSADIFKTRPSLQSDGTIIAELYNNDNTKKGTATITLTLKLEGEYTYQFKFNITNK